MTRRHEHDDNDPEVRVRRAISEMPFGGGLDRRWDPKHLDTLSKEPLTLEHVAMYLERLRDRLREVAKEHEEQESELREFRQAVAGIAYIFKRANARKET